MRPQMWDRSRIIAVANDTEYGLDAYVFYSDIQRAHCIANQLKAGSVEIKEVIVNYTLPMLPFGDVKQSGINCYQDKIGLRMVIDDGTHDTEPYGCPYTQEKLNHTLGQWEKLAVSRPEFSNPAAFNSSILEPFWEFFTVSLKAPAFVDKMEAFTG